MSGAIEVYGLAIRRLNNAELAKKPAATRQTVTDLRVRNSPSARGRRATQ